VRSPDRILGLTLHVGDWQGVGMDVQAEIAANVWKIQVEAGEQVTEGDELMILESMKMEIPVEAPSAGTVSEIRVAEKDQVQEGDVLAVIEP
jgi:biotin carboxyl carrier protein